MENDKTTQTEELTVTISHSERGWYLDLYGKHYGFSSLAKLLEWLREEAQHLADD